MKKFKILLITILSVFAFNMSVYAASAAFSVSKSSVYVGDSFTIKVNVSSAAAWNVHVKPSGPVSGCVINQADATSDAKDTNKSFSANCKATGEGTITLSYYGDVTSASDGKATKFSGSKTVTVKVKSSNPNSEPTGGNTNSPTNKVDTRSKNNSLKSISVDGFDLKKVDNKTYTLSVANNVKSINVKATASDAKAKVSGTGKHDLKVGTNNIEVVITSESGAKNKITLKVTRKDGYYIEDLDEVLKGDGTSRITLKDDTTISQSDLEKIKNSGKTVGFDYYNKDNKVEYSWEVDGSKITDTNAILTTITKGSDSSDKIGELSNYADGLSFVLKHSGSITNGTSVKLYVGDKYKDGSIVNVYAYNGFDKLTLEKDNLKVSNGYVDVYVQKGSEYFVTMSTIKLEEEEVEVVKQTPYGLIVIIIILVLIIAALVAYIFMFLKKDIKFDLPFLKSDDTEAELARKKAVEEETAKRRGPLSNYYEKYYNNKYNGPKDDK